MINDIWYITQDQKTKRPKGHKTTRPHDNKKIFWCWLGIGIISPKDSKIHHKSFQSRGKKSFYIYFCNRIHHKTTRKSCGGGWVSDYFHFHHKTTRFTTRVFDLGRKIIFIYIFVIEFTTRPQENLVVGGGYQNIFIFTTRPQDSPQEFSI